MFSKKLPDHVNILRKNKTFGSIIIQIQRISTQYFYMLESII